jgi:NAD-reducing hydrogenase small subunit
MSFLDLDERLIDLAQIVDVCYSPIADIKEFPQQVEITLVEGAVANEDNLRDIRRIRQRTKLLIAFGDCAVTGNVTALRNLFALEDVLQKAYGAARMTSDLVPALLPRVLRVQDVVAVDHFLPGCPPAADAIFDFLADVVNGRRPIARNTRFGA